MQFIIKVEFDPGENEDAALLALAEHVAEHVGIKQVQVYDSGQDADVAYRGLGPAITIPGLLR